MKRIIFDKLLSTNFCERSQWKQLRVRYPPKKYNVGDYTHLLQPLSSIRGIYDRKKSFDANWLNLYKELKRLNNDYDPNIQAEHSDLNFCIHLLLQIMPIIKNQPHLFNDEVDSSEWDFVVKFWGCGHRTFVLWYGPALKVDLRILHDRVQQRYNIETDVGVFEAAEEEPGNVKYIGDRCKVMIESKAVIDGFVFDGCLIGSVDSLQPLGNMLKYFNLASHLLCFRDQCVAITNQYEDHLINTRSKKISTKRNIHDLPKDDLIMKQGSIRGSWNTPRTSKSSPPPPSKNLFGNDS
ncbi:hypothetical protein G6F57_005860 [Rhizopus arrhizus]|uniref:Uncharacterized protein n=1 Tax=Rhizopus oryzae TaxID=64495 RepID=A0A9P7BTA9_RHIOR|nr:hypothetical protein G6F23_005625 [Rhizopus arrhizus]KAG1412267.1 hypothetical protein G6F58_008104 [Rhizopus delemar]KAG0764181.1 hypothetical protein G6F24_005419 [Rhizopus arrhizus]KAG0788683.1 hypothetical protein G6F21_007043 [Rhizopus arrhizus]KAG0810609.1 hypothetical protein G6F20_007821 [Rhizopus arrhizus]